MSKAFIVAAAFASLLSAGAEAQIKTYNVSGGFQDGHTFSGSFSFDSTKKNFDQYSNVAITLSGYAGVFDQVSGFGALYPSDPDEFSLYFSDSSNYSAYTIEAAFDATYSVIGNDVNLQDIYGTSLISPESTLFSGPDNVRSNLVSGSIAESEAAAVPESATWAMMILGMGAVGCALRRRKVTARVGFAA